MTVDDLGGGVMAGEILRDRFHCIAPVYLSGPSHDPRSQLRGTGFQQIFPQASVINAETWFRESGEKAYPAVLRRKPDGIFCANDRLAEGLWRSAQDAGRKLPPLVGFDDAPVARQLGLTTVAIPWRETIQAVMRVIKERLNGSQTAAARIVISPYPIVRS